MATLIDERPEADETADVEQQLKDTAEAVEAEPAPEIEEEIPEKYRGKSMKDIVRMHQEAEKAIGRHSNEVGQLRQVVDTFIQNQTETVTQQPQPEEELDFYDDPKKAVYDAISSHPDIRQAKEAMELNRRSHALAELNRLHPDMNDILNNGDFKDWVGKSKVRTRLLTQADSQYDHEAADELFSLWKERKGLVQETVSSEKVARKAQAKQASTGGTQGSAAPSSKKPLRRSDIIELMIKDPTRYAAMAEEIRQAYKEGRVK